VYSYLILIDGYNLINQLPGLLKAGRKSVDFARDHLLAMVKAYCDYNNAEGIIVYDGNQKDRTIEGGNPIIIFSKAGESADTVIESLIYKLDDKTKARVVTDDRHISNMITGMGAFTMSTGLFDVEARQALDTIRREIGDL
jgi:predicted RNA-binding protein with PIN domain